MTKSEEKLVEQVRVSNRAGALAGLGTKPESPYFHESQWRFVKRLYLKGVIVWLPWSRAHGSGWALAEYRAEFSGP